MKRITRNELASVPKGSIITKLSEGINNTIIFKGALCHSTPDEVDDYYEVLLSQPENTAVARYGLAWEEDGLHIPVDLHTSSRDGLYDEEEEYWVWDTADLVQLKTVVDHAIILSKKNTSPIFENAAKKYLSIEQDQDMCTLLNTTEQIVVCINDGMWPDDEYFNTIHRILCKFAANPYGLTPNILLNKISSIHSRIALAVSLNPQIVELLRDSADNENGIINKWKYHTDSATKVIQSLNNMVELLDKLRTKFEYINMQEHRIRVATNIYVETIAELNDTISDVTTDTYHVIYQELLSKISEYKSKEGDTE